MAARAPRGGGKCWKWELVGEGSSGAEPRASLGPGGSATTFVAHDAVGLGDAARMARLADELGRP
ncbi:hypothetical protein BKP30_22505 [Rhodococcus erythropolis]|nr:hypothetical protein BKP30_22505 [Rhodococcus erythropolis]